MKYAIWNNKGGVGKSFLTFCLSSEYARQHKDKKVFVIDMCPQANLSEILLGGNGSGASKLQALINSKKTIGGYIDSRLKSPFTTTGHETTYWIDVKAYNEHVPNNLYLVAGDPSLEVQAETINQIAGLTLPPDAWQKVHSWLDDMTVALRKTFPDCTVFIDCNPSFAAYTELAIVAADKLIVPCTADGSSARAIDNIGKLVYATDVSDEYKDAMFSTRLVKAGMRIPPIHTVILNRSTHYQKKAAKAFGAMFDDIKDRIQTLFTTVPTADGTINGNRFHEIPDTHSVTIVAAHKGLPISEINAGPHDVYGQKTQVNGPPLDRYRTAIERVAQTL